MSKLREQKKTAEQRETLLISLKIISRGGEKLDEEEAWQALVDAFKGHPTLDVFQALVGPDKDFK